MTAYVGAGIWDGTGTPVMRDAVLLVADGRVLAVGPPDLVEVPRGAREIRVDGKWIVPGMIDAHVHPERWALTRYVAWGVTAVRAMGGIQDSVIFLRDDVNTGRVDGPRMYIVGAVIDAPRSPWDAATIVRTTADARRAVGNRVLIDAIHVKVHAGITRPLLAAIVDEARALETPVAGHLARVDALTAARMGVGVIEHLSGVPEAGLRNPGSLAAAHRAGYWEGWRAFEVAWAQLDSAGLDRMARAVRDAGAAVVPTLVKHELWANLNDAGWRAGLELADVPEAERADWDVGALMTRAGLSRVDFAAMRLGRAAQDLFVRRFRAAGGRVAAGTDSPGPFTAPGASLHLELALLVDAGLTPEQALLAATRDAAAVLGIDSLGTLRADGPADFVVLNGDPFADIRNTRDIDRVVIGGVDYTPASLRAGW